MVGARFGDAEIVEHLLSRHPDLSAENYMGKAALVLAEKSDRRRNC